MGIDKEKTNENIEKMFDEISSYYDFMNDIISFFMHKLIKNNAIKNLKIKPNSKILDLCCGTGDLGRIIKKIYPESNVVGVDFSDKMLEIAKEKNPKIEYIKQNIQNMNFEDNSFDYIVSSFGLRNVCCIDKAIYEIHRILKKDGLFLNIEFGKKNIFGNIFDIFTSFFAKIFFKNKEAYSYLIKSRQEFLIPDELIEKYEKMGLKLVKRKDYIFGLISSQVLKK